MEPKPNEEIMNNSDDSSLSDETESSEWPNVNVPNNVEIEDTDIEQPNDANSSNTESKYFSCFDCDSRIIGSDCFRIDENKENDKCLSKIGLCYTSILNGAIARGCVGDTVFPTIESTYKYVNSIQLCNANHLCNQANIDDTCKFMKKLEKRVRVCSLGKPSGCYLKKSNERGCLKDLTMDEQQLCQQPGTHECLSCFHTNCNDKNVIHQKCVYCNGTTDSTCGFTTFTKTDITCIGYDSYCLIGFDANDHIHRKCSTNPIEDKLRFPKGYLLCHEEFCNGHPSDEAILYDGGISSRCSHSSTFSPSYCKLHPAECFLCHQTGNIQKGLNVAPLRDI